MSSLLQTFQDAIWVTRCLHVRYLWIDSLCIMQDKDDLSDWVYEAASMHKVYSNSLLNIAATGASDSSNGLFVQQDPQEFIPAEVNLPLQGLQPSAVPVKYQLTDISFWQKELSQAPPNRREWVVQKRLLAPRVLHFGRSQLMWECCEVDAAYICRDRHLHECACGFLLSYAWLICHRSDLKIAQEKGYYQTRLNGIIGQLSASHYSAKSILHLYQILTPAIIMVNCGSLV
jgi:Heterokaryon incompatibility protein (HET)